MASKSELPGTYGTENQYDSLVDNSATHSPYKKIRYDDKLDLVSICDPMPEPKMSPTTPVSSAPKMIGPHPSHIVVARSYILEKNIRLLREQSGVPESREDNIRLQGVTWIDNVRRALMMPVRTYDTACIYFHKFRLMNHDVDYNWPDAAAAALFTASKVEDTLKKSRDILCAAYNMRVSASERLTPDDVFFEPQAKAILGLERLMLETSAFDFRSRHPHKLLIKLSKFTYKLNPDTVCLTAFEVCCDIHRTFACLKHSTSTLAMASLELAARLHDERVAAIEEGRDYKMWNTNRYYIMEVLLDLIDLYTSHRASTLLGPRYSLDTFINIRILLNQEASSKSLPRYVNAWAFPRYTYTNGVPKCVEDPSGGREEPVYVGKELEDAAVLAPPTPGGERAKLGQKDTTVRFMLDGEKAREERGVVEEFFREEEEEFEVEVEEVVHGDREMEKRGREGREGREGRYRR